MEGDWSAKGFAALARDGFGCPRESVPEFLALLARLASAAPEERSAALRVPLADWLPAHVADEGLRQALLGMVKVIYCQYPERASAGRMMDFLAAQRGDPPLIAAYADDAEAGGMQGLMRPWARAIEERAGTILLGHKPVEVLFDGDRACGLLAVDPRHLALELRARAIVLAYPVWQALPLLPRERVAPELSELAAQLADEQSDAVGWHAGLRRLPRLRTSGEPDTQIGWNRLLVGPERRFTGGFHIPSLVSRAQAPEDRHLLHVFVNRWLRSDERIPWGDSRRLMEDVITYLRQYYADLDDCLEWSSYQYVERPAILAWYWAPVERHGVRLPDLDGLYLASTTIESDAGPVDIAAYAGLEAAREILADS